MYLTTAFAGYTVSPRHIGYSDALALDPASIHLALMDICS